MAKGIENSLIDDVLIDLTAEIMKEQEGTKKKQREGRWPERNKKKVRVGQREVHLAHWENVWSSCYKKLSAASS